MHNPTTRPTRLASILTLASVLSGCADDDALSCGDEVRFEGAAVESSGGAFGGADVFALPREDFNRAFGSGHDASDGQRTGQAETDCGDCSIEEEEEDDGGSSRSDLTPSKRAERWIELGARATTTGTDGSFSLDLDPDRQWVVFVSWSSSSTACVSDPQALDPSCPGDGLLELPVWCD